MSYACEWGECSFVSNDFNTFYEHVREHTNNFGDETECQWRHCFSDPYDNELELVRHVLFHGYHAKLKDLGLQVQTKLKLAPCVLDQYSSDSEDAPFQARNLVPDFPEQFSCLWANCGVVTSCPKYFYRHVDGHAGSLAKDTPNSIVPCQWKDCTFSSKKRFKLKEHCRSHTHEKCFSCPNCGGLFSNKAKFTDHLRRQNTMESESYQCSHCLKYCASERILRDHMRHHINNVKCLLCDMTCPTPSALQHHINFRHSDKKPFSCDMCDTSFKSVSDLRRHQQTHNPVYSYNCEEDECHYSSNTLQNLKRHHKACHQNVSGNRYECHICGVRYSRGTSLTKHLKKQHTFRWPAGHNRFRYKEDQDGMYRLQTVRFESIELSQELEASRKKQEIEEQLIAPEDDWEAVEVSNHQSMEDVASREYEDQPEIRDQLTSQPAGMVLQPEPSIVSPAPSHQHFLNDLNGLHEQYEKDTRYCSTVAAISSDVQSTGDAQSTLRPSQTQFAPEDDSFDVQEAVSLLAMLRNSGITYQQ